MRVGYKQRHATLALRSTAGPATPHRFSPRGLAPRTRGEGPPDVRIPPFGRWAPPHTRGWAPFSSARVSGTRLPRARGDGARDDEPSVGHRSCFPAHVGWTWACPRGPKHGFGPMCAMRLRRRSWPRVWSALDNRWSVGSLRRDLDASTFARKVGKGATTNDLFAILTTEPTAIVGPIHVKAMPVIVYKRRRKSTLWMTALPGAGAATASSR
jgi:hypothetical protein